MVVGADVSNAFAEAPAPGNTFYIIPDHIFHSWWVNHKKRQPIPPGWVLRVKFSLQGHPESPRLWEQHIRKILTGKQGYQCIMNAVYTKQSYMDTGPCYYDKWMTLPLQCNLKLLVGTLSTILTSTYASGLNTSVYLRCLMEWTSHKPSTILNYTALRTLPELSNSTNCEDIFNMHVKARRSKYIQRCMSHALSHGCGTGSAGGGCTSSARGRGLREAAAAPLRPPRGCCCQLSTWARINLHEFSSLVVPELEEVAVVSV